ncbi:MAG TPA: glycosyltransferase family 4 protein [Chloroflexia bacterium]|jgi:glycosyltransferase involved in cell wall biosynthesis
MRILHVIYDDIGNPWVGGGGAYRTLEIYGRIVRGGERIQVVCGMYPGADITENRAGVQYRRVGSKRSYVLSRLTYTLGAARLIKRGGYDIVIEDVSPFSPVGAPLWCGRTPSVASVQNVYGEHASKKYGLAGWGPRLVEQPLLSRFKNFVATSNQVGEQLRELKGPQANIRVIRYAASPVFFSAGQMPGGPRPEDPYILSIGRIDVYQKGLDRLVAAFDELASRVPTVRLLIAGGGSGAQTFALDNLVARARYRNRIRFVGQVDSVRAAELMKHALFVAIPSRYETGPITALEAGAAGAPVVGTNIAGLRDNAPPYPAGHGVLVPEDDVQALADAMRRVATDLDLREKLGEAGKSWAAQFTWDAITREQLDFYKELVLKRE